MHNVKNIIKKIVQEGDLVKMEKFCCMVEDLIEESNDPEKYIDELYVLHCGYHFNDEKLAESGVRMKWNVNEACSVFSSQGISFDGEYREVTDHDKCYVLNLMYASYYPLISDSSTAAKFAEKYIKDANYSIKGGKAYAEWKMKHKLEKHHMNMMK